MLLRGEAVVNNGHDLFTCQVTVDQGYRNLLVSIASTTLTDSETASSPAKTLT